MRKPTLVLDFDGVLHSYLSGWKGAGVIPDPPVAGAFEFLREAVGHFTVAIFSSRSNQPGGIPAMQAWLAHWALAELPPDADRSFLDAVQWPAEKPLAFVLLDDRAITFTGAWPSIQTLKAFQPWYKKAPPSGQQ